MFAIGILLVAFCVTWVATKLLIPMLRKHGVLDLPNARSSHVSPTPRGGGIGILAGIAAGVGLALVLNLPLPGAGYFVACAIIALTGLIDDRRGGLPVAVRLLVHLVAAAIVIFSTGGIDRLPLPAPLNVSLGLASVPVATLWLVAVVNLYNFLDGIDGFAGLQGVLAALGVALFWHSDSVGTMGFALAGACAGFLVYNWHPAKVFMGDVGSGTLGFALAALPFQMNGAFRSDAVFLVSICLWFFLSDGVFTIFRRASSGEKIWEAHRSHLYQRLVRTGLSHDRVVIIVLAVSALLAFLATSSIRSGRMGARWSVLILACVCFAGYYFWTSWREHKFAGQLGGLPK